MDDPLNDGGQAHEVISSADEDLAILRINSGNNLDVNTELLTAAEKGFSTAATLLLRKGADIMTRDAQRNTPLHLASSGNHLSLVKLLLQEGADLEARNILGDTPLNCSAFEAARFLVESGANINSANNDHCTPLHAAAAAAYPPPQGLELAKLLISKGAQVDCNTIESCTPLLLALEWSQEDMSICLIENGATVSSRDRQGNTPLHHAAKNDLDEATKLLLAKGANPNVTNEDGDTPLHIACNNRSRHIVQLLLEQGALVDSQDSTGGRPLHVALQFPDQSLAQLLLKYGADATAPDERGRTPLHLAATGGQIGVVTHLLDEGANIDAADSEKMTPLMHASTDRLSTNGLELLLERGANIDQVDEKERTALHVAIDNYNMEAAAILIKKGAGVKGRLRPDTYPMEHVAHRNVLHRASESQPIVLEFLLNNGDFDVEYRERHGWTALALAVEANNEDCVKLLLEHGANPDATARCDCDLHHKVPASHKAAKMGYVGVLQMLLDAGADPNSQDGFANTPLVWAAECHDPRCLEALLRTGMVDVNHANWERATPLYYAATFGCVESVRQLLRRVDVNRKVQTTKGVTAKEGALKKGYKEIFNLLEEDEVGIHGTENAAAAAPEVHSHWAACLNSLGTILMRRYNQRGRFEDLKESIRRTEQAIAATTKDDPNVAVYHNNLGIKFLRVFEKTERVEYLQKAIQQAKKAVATAHKGHPDHISCLVNLAIMMQRRFERTATGKDLRMAIRRTKRVIKAMPTDHPDRTRCLNNLGYLNQRLFEETGDMRDHREAARRTAQAVAAVPKGHSDLAACLSNFGTILARGFEKTQSTVDLDKAVHRLRQAVAATPKDHPTLAFYLHSLASILTRRSERKGRVGNLEEALLRTRQAIATISEDHHALASSLDSRIKRRSYHDQAWQEKEQNTDIEQFAAATSEDDDELTIFLDALAQMVWEFEMGSMKDLDDAIREMKKATAATFSPGCGFAVCLNNLRDILTEMLGRKERLEFEDAEGEKVEEDFRVSSKRIDAIEKLSELGRLLQRAFQRSERMEDLFKVFEDAVQTVDLIPVERQNVAAYLKTLGAILSTREKTFREDQEEAIRSIQASVAITPPDDPDFASQLAKLSVLLERRFEQSGTMEDLEEAIRCTEQAAQALIEDHPSLVGRLERLTTLLETHFDRTGTIDDLEEVIRRNEQVMASAPGESSSSQSTIDLMVVRYNLLRKPIWYEYNDCFVCSKLRHETKRVTFKFGELTGTDFIPSTLACSVCAMLRQGLALFDGYERKWFRDDLIDAVQATFFYETRKGSPLWFHTPWIDLEFFATEGNPLIPWLAHLTLD